MLGLLEIFLSLHLTDQARATTSTRVQTNQNRNGLPRSDPLVVPAQPLTDHQPIYRKTNRDSRFPEQRQQLLVIRTTSMEQERRLRLEQPSRLQLLEYRF